MNIADTGGAGQPFAGPAFEDPARGFFDRFTTQMIDLTIRPVTVGRALRGPTESLWPGLRFGAIAVAIAYAPMALCLPCFLLMLPVLAASSLPPAIAGLEAGMICVGVAAMPFVLLFTHALSDFIFGCSFHGLALLAGGRGSFKDSLRVAIYTRGVTAWMFLMWFLAWIPFVGIAIQVCFRVLFLLWSAFTFFGAGEGVHGLSEERALLVSVGTVLVGVLVAFVLASGLGLLVALMIFGSLAGIAAVLPH